MDVGVGTIELRWLKTEQQFGRQLGEKLAVFFAQVDAGGGTRNGEKFAGGVQFSGILKTAAGQSWNERLFALFDERRDVFAVDEFRESFVAEGFGIADGIRRTCGSFQFSAIVLAYQARTPIENERYLAAVAGMRESPGDCFFSARFILRRGVIERQLKAALGRIGCALNTGFQSLPARGLAIPIAFQTPRALRCQKQLRRFSG